MPRELLDTGWGGEYLLLWQSPLLGIDQIRPDRDGTSQRWLLAALQRWRSTTALELATNQPGETLRAEVEAFQRARNIDVDGIAGPKTLAHLSAVLRVPREPALIVAPSDRK